MTSHADAQRISDDCTVMLKIIRQAATRPELDKAFVTFKAYAHDNGVVKAIRDHFATAYNEQVRGLKPGKPKRTGKDRAADHDAETGEVA